MFFLASMDSVHGTSSTKLADWPRSDCQLQSLPLSLVHPAAVVAANAPPLLVKRDILQYGTSFDPFVLRPDAQVNQTRLSRE